MDGLDFDDLGHSMRLVPCAWRAFEQDDDVRKYVIARKFEKKGKTVTKRPHIQRLITPIRLQRKRARAAAKKIGYAKAQRDASEYARYVNFRSIVCAPRVVGMIVGGRCESSCC